MEYAYKKPALALVLGKVSSKDLAILSPVTDIQIFDNTSNFHPNGLFSTSIFGAIGTDIRKSRFGYIDLHCEIFHPVVYEAIVKLKALYEGIMTGRVNAIWDNKLKDFVKSNEEGCNTGYDFFFSKIKEIEFVENESDKRSFNIQLVKKAIAENTLTLRYVYVIPAGVRDYTIDSNGRPQEDEVNAFYRRLISQASLIDPNIYPKSPYVYDNLRATLQHSLKDIYQYFLSLLDGKNKLVLGKWLSRKIFNSTRNVLSNPVEKATHVDDPNRLGYNDAYVGLYQALKVLSPISYHAIRNKYLKDIFIEGSQYAVLTNVNTFKKEEVINSHIQKDYDAWTSLEGLERLCANFGEIDTRHLPIIVNKGKHCLGLVYNDGKYFKLFNDIDELPEKFDKKHVSILTYAQLFYISICYLSGKYPCLISRYPITGYGSVFPAIVKITTTTQTNKLEELNEEWAPSGVMLNQFPIKGKDFYNSASMHTSHFVASGADVDGDTISVTGVLSDEGVEEIMETLKSRNYYISPDNKFYFDIETVTLKAVLNYMT